MRPIRSTPVRAGEGNRTPVSSLGSLRSAIEPHPRGPSGRAGRTTSVASDCRSVRPATFPLPCLSPTPIFWPHTLTRVIAHQALTTEDAAEAMRVDHERRGIARADRRVPDGAADQRRDRRRAGGARRDRPRVRHARSSPPPPSSIRAAPAAIAAARSTSRRSQRSWSRVPVCRSRSTATVPRPRTAGPRTCWSRSVSRSTSTRTACSGASPKPASGSCSRRCSIPRRPRRAGAGRAPRADRVQLPRSPHEPGPAVRPGGRRLG